MLRLVSKLSDYEEYMSLSWEDREILTKKLKEEKKMNNEVQLDKNN